MFHVDTFHSATIPSSSDCTGLLLLPQLKRGPTMTNVITINVKHLFIIKHSSQSESVSNFITRQLRQIYQKIKFIQLIYRNIDLAQVRVGQTNAEQSTINYGHHKRTKVERQKRFNLWSGNFIDYLKDILSGFALLNPTYRMTPGMTLGLKVQPPSSQLSSSIIRCFGRSMSSNWRVLAAQRNI